MLKIVLVVCLAVQFVHFASACRCIPDKLPTPRYCRTPYLGLVKITSAVMEENQQRKHYLFELLDDLTTFGETRRSSLKAFHSIDDPMARTSCQVHLEVNRTYLVGVQMDAGNHAPVFTPCTSWIQPWEFTGAQSDKKIAEMKKHCGHPIN